MAGGGKVSVRQKMINMMYLVLTALLALNVSAEILKAFHLVEVSMEKAGANIDKKNTDILKAIDDYVKNNPSDEKGKIAQTKAAAVEKTAKEALKYLKDLKDRLIADAGGRKDGNPEEEVAEASNIEKHANLLINQGEGAKLKQNINDWRTRMIDVLDPKDRPLIKSDLITEQPKKASQTWESEMFEHSPIAAVVTLLTKTENDVKNTEAQVLDELKKNLTKVNVVVDQFEAKVIPNLGTYVTIGSKYSADIFLAASSSRSTFDLTVNGSPVKVENGIGKYETSPSHEGEVKYKGVITQKQLDGTAKTYPFEGEYFALKPIAVISATKMNVVYIGLENPISVSVPGYAANEVNVSLEPGGAGSLKPGKEKGTYMLTLNKGKVSELKVVASVKDKSGQTKRMGFQAYRVRQIPDPIPALGTIEMSGNIPAAQLKSQTVVRAPLKNFAFEGVNYIPYEFTFILQPKMGGNPVYEVARNQMLTPLMIGALSRAKKGDKVLILNIKVKGPDGVRQLPSPLAFDVQ